MVLKKILTLSFLLSLLWAVHPVFAADYADINGNVYYDSEPVCALVLANGQNMFTCSGDGSFNLNVPLDGNGQITLFVFVSGLAPFEQVYTPAQASNLNINMSLAETIWTPEVVTTVTPPPTRNRNNWVVISGTVDYSSQPVRIPDDPDHPFHLIPATDSISSRPVIPGHSGH